jgi:hypothetical protein
MRTTTVMATFKSAETKVAKELRSARGPSTKNTIAPPPRLLPRPHADVALDLPMVDRLCVAVIDLHQNGLFAPKEHELGTSSGAPIF